MCCQDGQEPPAEGRERDQADEHEPVDATAGGWRRDRGDQGAGANAAKQPGDGDEKLPERAMARGRATSRPASVPGAAHIA